MTTYRPDRIVRLLAVLASVAYFVTLVGTAVLLAGLPIVKVVAANDPAWVWSLELSFAIRDAASSVYTGWGDAHLDFESSRAKLTLPIGQLPWRAIAIIWVAWALQLAFLLLFLRHLRRIFQRARAGSPFNPANAWSLHELGVLLIVLEVIDTLGDFITAEAANYPGNILSSTQTISLRSDPTFDLSVVLVAIVLMGLAHVFRHGSELETEQSLVV